MMNGWLSNLALILSVLTYSTPIVLGLESELWDEALDQMVEDKVLSPLPITYLNPSELPEAFSWGDVDGGKSYLTRSLNQHIPVYCGSCWAHASLSSLADRIKIARKGTGDDINLSIQYILNCGLSEAGSCHGGSMKRTYKFIHDNGFVPYDTCGPYLACSDDSTEEFCQHVDTTCSRFNTCRTCTHDLKCYEIDMFPNATVAEYGTYEHDVDAIKAEIFARGPVGTSIAGAPLGNYQGGVFADVTASRNRTHAVSIVGWGKDDESAESYWIVRNSWGQYWGEMGFFRILMGRNVLGIESAVIWATPGAFTEMNFPCAETGENCGPTTSHYQDVSLHIDTLTHRLKTRRE